MSRAGSLRRGQPPARRTPLMTSCQGTPTCGASSWRQRTTRASARSWQQVHEVSRSFIVSCRHLALWDKPSGWADSFAFASSTNSTSCFGNFHQNMSNSVGVNCSSGICLCGRCADTMIVGALLMVASMAIHPGFSTYCFCSCCHVLYQDFNLCNATLPSSLRL